MRQEINSEHQPPLQFSKGSKNEIILTSTILADLIREALKLDPEIKELAQGLYQQKSLIVMGRGFNFATCLEGALVSP